MDFKNIPNKYRPIPFWSWNDKLNTEETIEQVKMMGNAGIGGFFMHARGGLKSEYMGDEWFENVAVACETAKENGMYAWAYDENGWPSGFGNGLVSGLGVDYQQKYLRMSASEPVENVICKSGSHWFYYEINPFYVDVLDKKVIRKFIEVSYEPYYEKYKNKIEGFFTDEPQISRKGIPWSFVFKDEYERRYDENLYEHLEELLLEVGEYKSTRVKFWKMVTDLFSESFMKQIYDKCNEWGLKFTGHLLFEESIHLQITSNGACMPHYEYMHIPGMDWLGRNIYDCLTPKQVSSVAEQLGKEQVVSETFALCGHNVSFAELKGIYEWQMVHGVNLLCQHLEGYSLRGIRKRDYPPAMYYQQPWWSEYDKFVEAMSRIGMILSKGEKRVNVLVIHPQTTAWSLYDDELGIESPKETLSESDKAIEQLDKDFLAVIDDLERKHVQFHLGDETIMERHGYVEDGNLIIGKQSYTHIITTCCDILLPSTEELLSEFESSGGKIVTVEEIPTNNVIDNDGITYTVRYFDDCTIHYFVNTSSERVTANVRLNGQKMDIYSGEFSDFNGTHEFEPWGSLVLVEGNDSEKTASEKTQIIHISDELEIVGPVMNTITLDTCDYYFDGELQEKNGYVLNIAERANKLEKSTHIHQDYYIRINWVPNVLKLVCETPELFDIKINGTKVDGAVCGYFRDKTFKTIDIAEYVKEGMNVISFDCDFAQSKEFYENLRNAYVFESEKNKLAYDMEIEAIYLLGDFAVRTDGVWTKLDKNAVRYSGEFEIDKPKRVIEKNNIEQQGYPFFSGEMTVETELDITDENSVLELDIKGINAVNVEINGIKKTILTDNRIPLNGFETIGNTKVKLTLINNLRNLLGPHHLAEGETYMAMPVQFYKEPCIWNTDAKPENWSDDYCFVETGI